MVSGCSAEDIANLMKGSTEDSINKAVMMLNERFHGQFIKRIAMSVWRIVYTFALMLLFACLPGDLAKSLTGEQAN